MNTIFYLTKKPARSISILMLLVFSLLPLSDLFAQQKVRKYATRQHDFHTPLVASVSNPGNAVSGNPKNAASLNLLLGAVGATYSEIVMDFNPNPNATSSYAQTIAANTPITIKLSLPQDLVGVGTGIIIQPITNLRRTNATFNTWDYDNVGSPTGGGTLLSLLSGAGNQEITITPDAAYQGVRVRLTGALSLSISMEVNHAYILENAPSVIACNDKIDALYGTGSYLGDIADLASGLGTVTNPWNVINGSDPSPTRLSYLLAEVGSYVYHTTIFRSPSVVGDSVRMVLRQTGTIASISVLQNSFSIQTYNGNSAGTPIPGTNTSLINIQLLPGYTDQFEIKFAPSVVFDRVELQVGALVNLNILTQPVDLISVERKKPTPTISGIGEGNNLFYQFLDQSITLEATGAGSNTVQWFNAQVGSAAVSNTIDPVENDLVYWAQTSSAGCTETSLREPAYLYAVEDNSVIQPGTKDESYLGSYILATATDRSFIYSLASGTLPPGLTLASDGAISGIPTQTGSFAFTVNITDEIETPNARTLGAMAISTGLTLSKSIDIGSLPVTLTHFKATTEGNIANLNWATTAELNSDRFEVMRSFDTKAWHKIGTVKSNGNSTVENNYYFSDDSPASGNNYYRLKMIDKDGSSEMSLIESITFDLKEGITISPNPTVERIYIKTENMTGVEKVELRNSAGQVLYHASNTSAIDVHRLPAGLYVLSITSTGGRITTHKVLKQ